MVACCQHDFVDWLAALGPTLATLFAGVATILVYLRGEKFQRQLVRPLLVFRHKIQWTNEQFSHWIVELRNEGHGVAGIDSFTLVAGEEIIEPEPTMRGADEYWHSVLTALGIPRIRTVHNCRVILPPLSVAPKELLVLFDSQMQGGRTAIDAAVRKLELRVHYSSLLGEKFTLHHRFGHLGP